MARKDGSNPSKRPLALLVAEGFLVLILSIYVGKIGVLAMYLLNEGPGGGMPTGVSWNLFIFLCEIAMLFVTADALLGISSRRPKGWKKAVRGSLLLLLFTIVGTYTKDMGSVSSMVTLDPIIVLPLVVVVFALMLLPGVRRYYVPPMEEDRPLSKWIGFAFFSELYPAGRYRIAYDEERDYAPEEPSRQKDTGIRGRVDSILRRL
ncbi:MAG: hypothetical protein Q4Q62_08425 [Thermoplasmata archaeon]|nr:hypothetical protein [Thermoplasmata archaeon]